MAKQIETVFYTFEREGMALADCFAATAAKFGISIDQVIDALNEAALA